MLHGGGEGGVFEVFTRAVLYFENAVGIEHPLATGAEGESHFRIACGTGDAERCVAGCGDFLPHFAVEHLRTWQAGAAEPHTPNFRAYEHGVDGNEAPRLHHSTQALVQRLHPLGEAHRDTQMRGGGDQGGAARHVQCGGQALAADIADAEEDFAIIDLVPEIEIAADLAGGFIESLDCYVAQTHLGRGKKGVLNFRGE